MFYFGKWLFLDVFVSDERPQSPISSSSGRSPRIIRSPLCFLITAEFQFSITSGPSVQRPDRVLQLGEMVDLTAYGTVTFLSYFRSIQ
jgi:hypothetical protein